ncbi:hypothetical protein [Alteribacter natronophilus]|uniref:hypothetical protein n=1 Tax=Alteribacter natronophilus TaxID=2583810 RepID=UPI00110DD914|nr:hypothetical protein [Alteribacter natronophilus]TMW70294.1 hypothetical protein FGB90_16590 [Alteribacter natronophilus]
MKKLILFIPVAFFAAGLAGCNGEEGTAGEEEQPDAGQSEEASDHNGDKEENGADSSELESELEEREETIREQEDRIAELEAEIDRLSEEEGESESDGGSGDPAGNGETGENGSDGETSRPRMTPEEDFYTQFWFGSGQTPEEEEMGFEPGVTDWQDYRGDISSRYTEGESEYVTAEVLAMDWIRERETETMMETEEELAMRTYYEENGESAKILFLHWGLKDDAIAGEDFLLHLSRDGDIWTLDEVEERYYCRRGMDEDASICH